MQVENLTRSPVASSSTEGAFSLKPSHLDPSIWVMTFDLPGQKVNKLDRPVMDELAQRVTELKALHGEGKVQALVVVSGKPGSFIAGADIKLFEAVSNAQEATQLSADGQQLLNDYEDLPFPTVAAVNGVALGGGCEFCLASNAIVMSDAPSAKIGLPEVMLGVIPGLGGCVRLPRKVGLASALDLILTGKQIDGKRAQRMGLIEGYLPKEDFESSVLRWTQKNLKSLKQNKRIARPPRLAGMGGWLGSLIEGPIFRSAVVFKKAKQGILKATKGHAHYPAPLEALSVIQGNGIGYGPRLKGGSRARALKREAQGFGRCAVTEVSRNLIRIFFLTEEVKKSNGLAPGSQVEPQKVAYAGVLGAGIMGGGIAQLFADKGIPTRMKDIQNDSLETGLRSAAQVFKKKLKRKRINHRQYQQKMNLISPVLDYQGFGHLDVVVEAVIEKMDIKKSVLRDLEEQIGENCVVATNTSSLSVSEMQEVLKRPQNFVGMHFFNPVHRMPLVEVIRGSQSSDFAVASIYEFCKKLGKTPIVVKDAAGFLVNRLLVPYMNEALYLLTEGVPMEKIDKALIRFGMPMGPMELVDEVGVDTGEKVLNILHQAFGERMKPAQGVEKITQAERYGKKNGKGIYRYEGPAGRQKKNPDPVTYELLGVKPLSASSCPSEEEMVERCILPIVNEASRCLAEGVVARPHDVDLGMIFGTGFAPFRGGPMRYADHLGLNQVMSRLQHYAQKLDAQRFAVASSLSERANSNQLFYS